MRTRLRPSAAAIVSIAACTLLLLAAPARAQDDGWSVTAFDVTAEVTPSGDLLVVEDLTVDYGTLDKHGIFRDIPVRFDVPPDPWYPLPDGSDPDALQRAIDIDDIEVTSPTAPADMEAERPGPTGGEWLRLRIGDEDTTVTGPHQYRISYRVVGALDRIDGQPELFWNATGNAWDVPIERASATVTGGDPTEAACFVGGYGATDTCARAAIDGISASYVAEGLLPGEGLSVATRFEPGSVTVPDPLLVERWSFTRALAGSALAWPLALLTALVGFGGVGWLAYRQGRDRVLRGGVTAAGMVDSRRPDERRRRLTESRTVAVRYRPPDGLRPAQLGLIVDESVDPVDISATIVDLAVRGHLTIEEAGSGGWGKDADWRLRRSRPADRGDVRPELAGLALLPYEQRLLDALFADGGEVLTSDLKGEFHREYEAVERDIYADGQQRRWFSKRPDHVRSTWLGVGIGVTVVALALLAAAVLFSTVAVAVVPLVVAGIALTVAHRWMPHRTPRGSRLLEATLGFREFIETADAERLQFAEAENLFVPYLPYAVVFGETERWARAFADLGVDAVALTSGWYVGYGAFDVARFSAGMHDFSATVSSSLPSVPATSSSGGFSGGGFSGGGFGGGGGGSW